MNQMAFEIGWAVDQAGGLWNVDLDDLNRHLRRVLHTKDGEYQVPLGTRARTTRTHPASTRLNCSKPSFRHAQATVSRPGWPSAAIAGDPGAGAPAGASEPPLGPSSDLW
jgi:hypothetical protein